MKNSDVRVCAIEHGVRLWELADQLGISPETLSRKLRRELVPEDKERTGAGAVPEMAERQEQVVRFPAGADERDLIDQQHGRGVIPDRNYPPVRGGKIPQLDPGMKRGAVNRHVHSENLARVIGPGQFDIG